jgi:CheY-like chemotaxis protein
MYGLAFSAHDHQLSHAENGRQGLDLLATSGQYDVILLDLRMPDMNGVEFIKAAQRQRALRHIPIVLTTAEADDSPLLRQATALHVAAVVKKPWKPKELRAVVESVVGTASR